MKIVWLGEEACNDCSLVGGKAANLSILHQQQTIPFGFCITAEMFAHWSGSLEKKEFPEDLRKCIVEAYEQLSKKSDCEMVEVAVRSSAIDEDGEEASFAGQYETYLNIKGADALIEAIIKCWNSSNSDEIKAYRKTQQKSLDVPVAVLVQQLVYSDASAVIFTSDPITKSNQNIIINANWGLGDSVVSGKVTPDSYTVRKEDLSIEEKKIAKKELMTIRKNNTIEDVKIPGIMSSESSISEQQIIQAAEMSLSLEKYFGHPVDIECTWKGEQIYLLQCRPITTTS